MSTISHEPSELLHRAIAIRWLAVLFTSIYGPDIATISAGGDSSHVPSGIVVAFFAFLGTWVVARSGFRHEQ